MNLAKISFTYNSHIAWVVSKPAIISAVLLSMEGKDCALDIGN